MGCCLSRAAGPNSPYPGGIPNSSDRHMNPPPLTLPESIQRRYEPRSANHTLRGQENNRLFEHINKPLKQHLWTSKDRRWKSEDLQTERAEFFETRVTGRPEIWQAIHASLRILWADELKETNVDGADSLATAQTILSAADISLPTGDLANGVYDSLGNFYALPEWVVSDPQNIVASDSPSENGNDAGTHKLIPNENKTAADSIGKGKEAESVTTEVELLARLSETGRDVKIYIRKNETAKSIIQKISEKRSLSPSKKIKLAYMGKMLKENSTLEEQGWVQGHVINALVFDG